MDLPAYESNAYYAEDDETPKMCVAYLIQCPRDTLCFLPLFCSPTLFPVFFFIDRIAAKLSMDVKDLVAINKIEYKGLQHYSKLMPGTKLIVAYDGRMMVRFFFFSHKNISLVYMGT